MPKPCDCLEQVNEQLKTHNTVIDTAMSLSAKPFVDILISTSKLNSKGTGKAKMVIAAYCPFCGQKRP